MTKAAVAPSVLSRGRYAIEAVRSLTLVAIPTYLLVLLAHGFLPGLLNDGPGGYLAEGGMRCLNELGLDALTSWCHAFGEPLGYPLLSGGPVLAVGAMLMELPGIDSYGAYLLAGAAFDALALAGGYGLMRRLGAPQLIALGAAAVYLVTPTVIGMRAFGGTFTGFTLLPAYAWLDLVATDAVARRWGRSLAVVLGAHAAARTGALFLDGYSFVASVLTGACLWAAWLARSGVTRGRKAIGATAFAAANAVAVALYRLYVPANYEENPIGIFRSMGLDVVSLAAPTEWLWPAAKLGYASQHVDLWGDGTNVAYNYVGFTCLLLAAGYLASRRRRTEPAAIAAAGAIAFVLSLGPSLKVHEVKPEVTSQPDFASYLMPEGIATADLPWSGLFTAVPGVDAMRAAYRWFGVTRLALIVLAALAIARLAVTPGRRRWAGAGLAALALVELLPNLPLSTRLYETKHEQATLVREEVEPALRRATREGERAFFLSYDGEHNDYLVNFLAAGAGLRAYNAGGDKNALMAQRTWPPEIVALAGAQVAPESVAEALRKGVTDLVIAPFFHLRWSSYTWPPVPEVRAQAKTAFESVLRDPRLRVERHRWFATIRLAREGGRS